MDFLILMVRGRPPGIGVSGESGKTRVNFVDA